LKPPAYLSVAGRKIFRQLEEELAAANVPIKAIDAHAIGLAAAGIEMCQQSKDDAPQFARVMRDTIALLQAIGGTPHARTRLGVKDKQPVKSKTAALLELAKQSA
jgi:phage terminase small subunit